MGTGLNPTVYSDFALEVDILTGSKGVIEEVSIRPGKSSQERIDLSGLSSGRGRDGTNQVSLADIYIFINQDNGYIRGQAASQRQGIIHTSRIGIRLVVGSDIDGFGKTGSPNGDILPGGLYSSVSGVDTTGAILGDSALLERGLSEGKSAGNQQGTCQHDQQGIDEYLAPLRAETLIAI
jgi:hypothetical protein